MVACGRIEVTTRQTAEKLHPQYVTDTAGNQTNVILPLGEYTELLEDLDDLAVVAERVNEPTVPRAKVVAELRAVRLSGRNLHCGKSSA